VGNEVKQPILPQALYFDTNALRQLVYGISNVDFVELRKYSEVLDLKFFAPEVVVKEWLNQRERSL